MFSIKRVLAIAFFCIFTNSMLGQSKEKKPAELELGFAFAVAEAAYFGVYSKVSFSLKQSKNYFYGGETCTNLVYSKGI